MNDLSLVQDWSQANFTITVSGTQANGTYKLAEGATGFNKTITVKNTLGEELGKYNVGEIVTIGDYDFSLSLVDGALSLVEINIPPEPPSLIVTTAADIVNKYDGLTSIREAITYAKTLGSLQTITFNMSDGNDITISDPEFINHDLRFASTNSATGKPVTVTLDNLSISGRRYSDGGDFSHAGGSVVHGDYSNIVVSGGTFTDNRDESSYNGWGGAIRMVGGTLTIDGAIFDSNSSTSTGGAVNCDGSTNLTIRNTLFENNSNYDSGGAVIVWCINQASMTDTVFVDNSGWKGGAVCVHQSNLVYEVTENTTITNVGNSADVGGFMALTGDSTHVEFRVDGTLNIGNGDGKDSFYTEGAQSDVYIRKTGSGTMTIDAPVTHFDGQWFIEDGVLTLAYAGGGNFDGDITISGGQMQLVGDYTLFKKLTFELGNEANEAAYLNDISKLTGGSICIDAGKAGYGTYKLADGAATFDSAVTLTVGPYLYSNSLTVGKTITLGDSKYTLGISENTLTLQKSENPEGAILVSDQTISDQIVAVLIGTTYSNTILASGGHMDVGFGGKVNGITVTSGGELVVSSGAVVQNVTLSSGARLVVLDGGIATGVNAVASGYATVSSGGKMIDAYLAGGNCEDQVVIEYGGILSSATLDKGLNLVVRGSGYDLVFQNDQGGDYSDLFLYNGGYAENVTMCGYSYLYMDWGTKVNGLTLYGSDIMYGVSTEARIENLHLSPITDQRYKDNIPAECIVSYDSASVTGVYYGSGTGYTSALTTDAVQLGNGAFMYVLDSGTANRTAVNSGAKMHVSSGGAANSTTVNSGGSVLIFDGGVLNGTTVNSGWMHASSGGTVTDATFNDGLFEIGRYGAANSITVNSSARITVFSTGVANSTTVLFGSMTVSSGGTANGIELSGFGSSGGAVSNGVLSVTSSGMVDNVIVNNGGDMTVSKGAVVTNILENGGNVKFEDGATVSFLENTISGLVVKAYRDATVHSNTSALDTTVDGGWFFIRGGTANNTTILNGSMWVSSGVADTVSIGSNCLLYVSSGGTANSTTVNSGGSMCVNSGGVANGIVVNGNGTVEIAGVASGLSANSRGYVYVRNGGLLVDAYCSGGIYGRMITVYQGGTISSARIVDGVDLYISGYAKDIVLSGAIEDGDWSDLALFSGGYVENVDVYHNGNLDICSGGTATNVQLHSGAILQFSSGAVVSNVVFNKGAAYGIQGGAIVTGIVENGGFVDVSNAPNATFVSNTFSGTTLAGNESATVHSGTTATSTTVSSGARMEVFRGGVADGILVSRGGVLQLDRATDVSNVKVMNSGYLNMTIDSGTNVAGTFGGSAFAVEQGAVEGFELNDMKSLTLRDGGTANNAVVSSGGALHISSGGVANGASVENEGWIYLSSGGTANGATLKGNGQIEVQYGASATGLNVSSGGSAYIRSGANVSGLAVENGAWLDLTVDRQTRIDGTISGTVFEVKDGRLDDFTIGYGRLTIDSEGIAYNLTTRDSVDLTVAGGTIHGLNASSWGWWWGGIRVDGGLLTGQITVTQGNLYFSNDGAILFNVSDLAPDVDTTRLNDYGRVSDSPLLYATVSDAQMQGSYVLARNADSFKTYITVNAVDGTFLEELSIGQQFEYAGKTYALNRTDGVLTLDVAATAATPVITIYGDTTTPTQSTTVTAEATAGSELYFSHDNRTWFLYDGPVAVTQQGSVYFKAVDGAGRIGTNWMRFDNVDTVPPAAPVATPNITVDTVGKVMVGAEFSDDSVIREYSMDGTTWNPYVERITFTQNGTVYFRATDAAGNVSEATRYDVTNIVTDPTRFYAFVNPSFGTNGEGIAEGAVHEPTGIRLIWGVNAFSTVADAIASMTPGATLWAYDYDQDFNTGDHFVNYVISDSAVGSITGGYTSGNRTVEGDVSVTIESSTIASSATSCLLGPGSNWDRPNVFDGNVSVNVKNSTVGQADLNFLVNVSDFTRFTGSTYEFNLTDSVVYDDFEVFGDAKIEDGQTIYFTITNVTVPKDKWWWVNSGNFYNSGDIVVTIKNSRLGDNGNMRVASYRYYSSYDASNKMNFTFNVEDSVIKGYLTPDDHQLYEQTGYIGNKVLNITGGSNTINQTLWFKEINISANAQLNGSILRMSSEGGTIKVDATGYTGSTRVIIAMTNAFENIAADGVSLVGADESSYELRQSDRLLLLKDKNEVFDTIYVNSGYTAENVVLGVKYDDDFLYFGENAFSDVSSALSALTGDADLRVTGNATYSGGQTITIGGDLINDGVLTISAAGFVDGSQLDAVVLTADSISGYGAFQTDTDAYSAEVVGNEVHLVQNLRDVSVCTAWNGYQDHEYMYTWVSTGYWEGTFGVDGFATLEAAEQAVSVLGTIYVYDSDVTFANPVTHDVIGYGETTVLRNAKLAAGKTLTVSNGARIMATGLEMGEDASVVFRGSTSVLEFDISAQDSSTAGQADLSRVSGRPVWRINMSSDQALGQYVLATGADAVKGSFELYVDQNSTGWSLSVTDRDTFTQKGNQMYSLYLGDEGELVFSYVKDTTGPVLTAIGADITAPTNTDVTVTAEFTDDYSLKDVFYRIGENGSWRRYPEAGVTVSDNDTVYFYATDTSGNSSSVASYVVGNIDKTPPVAPVVTADVTAPTRGSVTLTAAFGADSVLNEYSRDGVNWGAYVGPVSFVVNGSAYFRSRDAVGNISSTVYEVGNIDTTPPETPVVSADVTTPTNRKVTVSAAFSADTEVREYSFDNWTWEVYPAGGVEFTSNGTVYFRGKDAAGNISDVERYVVANIDTDAPVAPTAAADITAPTNQDVTVTASFSSDSVVREYSLDGSNWLSYVDGGVTMSGNGTVYFRGWDEAGNASDVTPYDVTNINKTAPNKPAVSASVTGPTNQDVTVTASFSPESVVKEFSYDQVTWRTYLIPLKFSENGTIYFRGTDSVGNVSDVTTYVVDNIDKVAPDAPGVFADITARTNTNVLVTATFSADSVVREYSLDGGENWQEYTGAITFRENGTAAFRGWDAAGNVSEETGYTVDNIDKVAPVIQKVALTQGADNYNFTATVTASDDTTAMGALRYFIKYSDSAAGLLSADSRSGLSFSLTPETSGRTMYYQAGVQDLAGNLTWSGVQSFTVYDRIAPELHGEPTASFANRTVTLAWDEATDNLGVAGYRLKLNGVVHELQTPGFVLENVAAGDYTYQVVAYDAAGNETASAEKTLTVDALPDLKIRSAYLERDGKIVTTVSLEDAVTMRIQVENIGDAASALTSVYVYCGIVQLGEISLSAVEAGRTSNVRVSFAAERMSTGIQDIRVVLDPLSLVEEYSELNNEKILSVNVEDHSESDLVIGTIGLGQESYSLDEDVTLTFTVRNIGYNVAAATKAYIYDGSTFLDSIDVDALEADGESARFTYTIAAGSLEAGSHVLRVVANGEAFESGMQTVPETNLENNSAQVQVVVGLPDLSISKLTLSRDTINTEENVTLSFTVRNGGLTTAAASVVGIYDGDRLLGTMAIDELSAGLSTSRQFEIAPRTLEAGEHDLRVVADYNSQVKESDETNNARSIALPVTLKDVTPPNFLSISIAQDADYGFTITASAQDNVTPASELVYGFRFAKTADEVESAVAESGSTFSLTPADACQTMYYQVSATDKAGNTAWSDIRSFTVADHTAPEFGDIQVSIANAALSLSWEATDNVGVMQYDVYFDDVLRSSLTTKTTYTIENVPSGLHSYRIDAFDASGNVGSTGTLNVNIDDTVAPEIISVGAVQASNGYGIAITVNATDNETPAAKLTKRVQYAFSQENVDAAQFGGLTFKLNPEDAARTLYYRVSVSDEAGNITFSDVKSLTVTDTTAPDVPTDLTGTVEGFDVALNWTAPTDNVGVTGYLVRYGATESLNGEGVRSNGNSFMLNSMKDGVYYWQTAAVDAAGNVSGWSEVKRFRVLPEDAFGSAGTAATAYKLGELTGEQTLTGGVIRTADDADWFSFTLTTKGTANDYVQIAFDGREGDLDLYLYSANGATLLATSAGSTGDTEKLSLKDLAKGSYLLKVVGKNGATNKFDLSTRKVAAYDIDEFDANGRNDTQEAATVFNIDTTSQGSIANLTLDEPWDVDFYQFTLSNMGFSGDSVSISFENSAGDLDLHLFDSKGNIVAASAGTGNTETISFSGFAAGTYYIQVSAAHNAMNEYTLDWNFTSNKVLADRLEGKEPYAIAESVELADLSISEAGNGVTQEDTFKLTLQGPGNENSKIRFSNYRSDWNGLKYVVKDASSKVVLSGTGSEVSLNGLASGEYTLTVDTPVAGSFSSYDISVSLPEAGVKWTYMVYMATDNGLDAYALNDLIALQQANLDAQIDIYVLVDRSPSKDSSSAANPSVVYKWDSNWSDTRVGKISYSPGRNCTVDWESWGELDTSSASTLERFVTWTQEQSSAENYALIMWDHGFEDGRLCVDGTTDADWNTALTVSDVASVIQDKDVSLVVFNNCLLGSELTATQMTGSTEVIVASEAESYPSGVTYGYKKFFSTIKADMTAQEMAEVLVQNVRGFPGDSAPSMLSAVDVTDNRLGEALEALANAVTAGKNDADKSVLINGMLKTMQDGCAYPGNIVYQSDLYDVIVQAMADRDYTSTSAGFKTALTNLKSTLESIVITSKSVPANRGYGVAVFNPALTAKTYAVAGYTSQQVTDLIYAYLDAAYGSDLAWTGLLYDLATTYQSQYLGASSRVASFSVNSILDLEKAAVVSSMDLGCFSGQGEVVNSISLFGELYFSIAVTEDKNTGKFTVTSEPDTDIVISILDENGATKATGTNSVSFANLEAGDYLILLESAKDCTVTLAFGADWATGVDRFDYAQSRTNEAGVNGNGSISKANALGTGYYSGLLTYNGDSDWYQIGNVYTDKYRIELEGEAGLTVEERDANGNLVQTAKYSDGKYMMTMLSMDYLVVEGSADISDEDVAKRVNAYSVSVTTAINDDTEDTVPPAAPVASSDVAGFTNGDVVVTAIFSTDSVVKEFSLDGENWQAYTFGVVVGDNGPVYFRAADAAGNVSDVTAFEVTNIDKVAPAAPTGLVAEVKDQSVTLSWTASTDDLSGVKGYVVTYSHDGQEFTANTTATSFVIENAEAATWNWTVKAVDAVDNVSEVAAGEAFTVEQAVGPEPPTPAKYVAKFDVDGNGISDVMFVWSGNNYAHGYWMNGTNEWRSTMSIHPAEWENLGCYDMTGDGKADSVLVGNVVVEGVKGAYIGYYADAIDAIDGSTWVNIDYLNNEANITWVNKIGNLTGGNANSIVWYAPELYTLGAWTDGTSNWVTMTGNFGGDDWKLVGCGDFNGDGKDSVVMSGAGGAYFYAADLDGTVTSMGAANWSGWTVRAIGDFAGDGKDDLVLFHEELGSMVLLADGNLDDFTSIGQLDAADWFVVGAGDYNADQKDDLLVRQYSTGMLGYYISGDTSQWVELGRGVGMEWTVIA